MDQCREAFQTLKDRLYNAPTLMFPIFDLPFILYTDSSKERGYGAALYQVDPTDGKEKPVLYLLKTLTPAEQNYWPTELETGALV